MAPGGPGLTGPFRTGPDGGGGHGLRAGGRESSAGCGPVGCVHTDSEGARETPSREQQLEVQPLQREGALSTLRLAHAAAAAAGLLHNQPTMLLITPAASRQPIPIRSNGGVPHVPLKQTRTSPQRPRSLTRLIYIRCVLVS